MKLKKILASLLALAVAVGMTACTSTGSDDVATVTQQDKAVSADAAGDEAEVPSNPVIRLSTTTSVNDSGLLPYLQPAFEAATGYTLEIASAGTGAALNAARDGNADALLVHSKASEEEFIAEGYAAERIPFMYNYFVIVGPTDDPAGVADAANATEAFQKIAASGASFISRGDESGTHKAELKIWEAAELAPAADTDAWYVSAGQGMGAVLTMAAEQGAYTLTDKATYLAHENKDDMALLMEESEEMMNTYSMLAVSAEKWPDTNVEGANAFITWMTSDEAKELIAAYGMDDYGQQLFYLIED